MFYLSVEIYFYQFYFPCLGFTVENKTTLALVLTQLDEWLVKNNGNLTNFIRKKKLDSVIKKSLCIYSYKYIHESSS